MSKKYESFRMKWFLFFILVIEISCATQVKRNPVQFNLNGKWSGGKGIDYVHILGDTGYIIFKNRTEIPIKIELKESNKIFIYEESITPGILSNYIPIEAAKFIGDLTNIEPGIYEFTFNGSDQLEGIKVAWLLYWRAGDKSVVKVDNHYIRPEKWIKLEDYTNQ